MPVTLRITEAVSTIETKPTSTVQVEDAFNTDEREPNQKAAFRKFVAENNLQPRAIPDDLLDLYIKYGNNSDGIPALNAAIEAGDEKAVRLFLDHGANPNSKSNNGRNFEKPNTALEFAAKYGQLNIAKLLIERGAKIDVLYEYGPLIYAVQANQSEIIKFLIEKGAKITPFSPEKELWADPIYCAVQSGSVASLKTLIELGGKLNNPELAKVCDLLQTAAYSGKIEMVRFLLDRNVPIDHATFIYGASAISAAIAMKNIEMTKLLIAHGAKIQDDAWSSACQSDEPTLLCTGQKIIS